jgi:hypothetical protein
MIYGSLPKYLQGENIMPLDRKKVMQGIKRLEYDTRLGLKDAIVCSVEFGTSIITQEKPFEYLSLFGYPKRLTRVEFSKWDGIETVMYTSKKGAYEFIGYDKTKEMLGRKKDIPPLFDDTNVLRLEYKILSRKGIKAKFARDLLAYDLFNENVYRDFQRLFLETYETIDKTGRQVYLNNLKKLTPSKIRELQAEQYRQNYPKEYQYFIQRSKEAGQISPRSLERIRAADRKNNRNIYISDQNTLLRELDALVFDIMQSADYSSITKI